jgi:DNA-binding GntR family transcriptional regulator
MTRSAQNKGGASQPERQGRSSGALVRLADWAPELQKARVYEQVLLDIILGELAPGAQLDEKALASRYNAGLAGVRDTLGRLALEGLVVRRPRAGTFVSPLDLGELRQDYEARTLIEPECAAMAALYGSPEDIAAIKDAFRGGEDAARQSDSRALVAMDQRFHAAVARATGNSSLTRLLIPLQHKAARYWVFSMETGSEEERIADVRDHLRIAEMIAAKDAEGARAAMMSMLRALPGNVWRTGAPVTAAPGATR